MRTVMTSRLASAAFVVLLAGLIAGAAGLWVARGADPVQGQEFPTFDRAAAQVEADIGRSVCGQFETYENGGETVDHDVSPSDQAPAAVRDIIEGLGLSMDDFVRDGLDHRVRFTRSGQLRLSTATGDRQLVGALVEVNLYDNGQPDGPEWALSELAVYYECDVTDTQSDATDGPSTEEERRP